VLSLKYFQPPDGIFVPEGVAGAVLEKVKQFKIGFGRAGDTPAAKGTGVLIRHDELHGILTCAHVDQYLRELKQPVGLVPQFGTIDLGGRLQLLGRRRAMDQGWRRHLIHRPPQLVGNIAKDRVFLDADKSFSKPEPDNPASLIPAYSVFGLVDEFTGARRRGKTAWRRRG
jgi:hypothetical protein